MFYAISGKDLNAGLVTADGVVLHATRDLEWACGESIEDVLSFFERQRIQWSVSDALPAGMVAHDGIAEWAH